MSNIIHFASRKQCSNERNQSIGDCIEFDEPRRAAAVCASAKDALDLLVGQLEVAMLHARSIEARMLDPKSRRDFGDRIEQTQSLLDLARRKVLRL
jgi:hypothetical protein